MKLLSVGVHAPLAAPCRSPAHEMLWCTIVDCQEVNLMTTAQQAAPMHCFCRTATYVNTDGKRLHQLRQSCKATVGALHSVTLLACFLTVSGASMNTGSGILSAAAGSLPSGKRRRCGRIGGLPATRAASVRVLSPRLGRFGKAGSGTLSAAGDSLPSGKRRRCGRIGGLPESPTPPATARTARRRRRKPWRRWSRRLARLRYRQRRCRVRRG